VGAQTFLVRRRARPEATVCETAGEERTEEVVRMLSGAELNEASRKHSGQMIPANG